jgi:uncharacterized repeat protein (TIGR03803 family)
MKNSSAQKLILAITIAFALTASAFAQYTETLNIGQITGIYPYDNVTLDKTGDFFGTVQGGTGLDYCYYGCGIIYEVPAGTEVGQILYEFSGTTDGSGPSTRLTFDAAGNLYGVTVAGGDMTACNQLGCGVVFKLSPNGNGTWTESVLYAFTGTTDGNDPFGGVVFDAKGNLYGVTAGGGTNTCQGRNSCGTVFELSPGSSGWTLTTLHSFNGGPEGGDPSGVLTVDSRGTVYGTAFTGGNTACTYGCGVVYSLSPTSTGGWNYSRLFSFNGADGQGPNDSLVFDRAGNIYGATGSGGNTGSGENCPFVTCGVVYELVHKNGTWKESTLYKFTGNADGSQPRGGVSLDASGNVFGTAAYGGQQDCGNLGYPPGCGTAWELSRSSTGWTFNLIYGFTGGDGEIPNGNLIVTANGNLIGTSVVGDGGYGNIFVLSPPAGVKK